MTIGADGATSMDFSPMQPVSMTITTPDLTMVGALRYDEADARYVADPSGDLPVPVADDVLACDAVIPVARIKPHTGFRGPVESGICKMLCVGLGKHAGCSRYHREGYHRFAALMPAAASVVLATGKVPFALAVVENAAEHTARIEVRDSGIGIPRENLTRIFQHGFTTKKNGHGFGLHVSANAATEMGAKLTATSDGPGRGAAFFLDIPIETEVALQAA